MDGETKLRDLQEVKISRAKRDLSKHKCEKVEGCLSYFAARAEYMKYDEYPAAGYPIESKQNNVNCTLTRNACPLS